MASTHAQTAPPLHQFTNPIIPLPPHAPSTSNSLQKEEVRWPQTPNTQPEHPARPRFAPVSSATLAAPEGISGGRLNNGGQPRSLSAIAKIDQNLEVPESLRKAQEELRGLKPPEIKFTFSPTMHNHNTNINNPQPGSNTQGRQSSSQSSSQHDFSQPPLSQQPSFQHASSQQPFDRQQPPIREPRVFQAYPFADERYPNHIEYVWTNLSCLAGRAYKSLWVWAVTITVLYMIGVLVWYCLSSQEIYITSPPKNITFVAANEEFAIDGSLQSSIQQSLANSHVNKADKAVLCELSDRLAINQRDTTNSDSEVLSKLREIFAIGQDPNISNFGYKDDLLTTLYYYLIALFWPWTNTHARRRWTALAAASLFELPIQQLLAAGESHLNNFTAWKSTLEDLFKYLRKQEQLGLAVHTGVRSLNSNLLDGLDTSLCALRPLSQRAHGAYNRTRDSAKEVEELEEQCRMDGKGCEKLGDLLLGGKVFKVLGKWME